MREINIKDELGIIDLDDKKLFEAAKKLDIKDSNEIELNFFSVIIAYPGTSIIIDKVFELVKNVKGSKKITIKTNFYQNEEELFNAIFWGSLFFDIEVYKFVKSDKIREIVTPKLSEINTSLFIELYDQSNELVKKYEL